MRTSKHSQSSGKPLHTAPAVITADDLPAGNNIHWNQKRKAIVVSAVLGGLISIRDACERYELSIEEFLIWKRTALQTGTLFLCEAHHQEEAAPHPIRLAA